MPAKPRQTERGGGARADAGQQQAVVGRSGTKLLPRHQGQQCVTRSRFLTDPTRRQLLAGSALAAAGLGLPSLAQVTTLPPTPPAKNRGNRKERRP